MDSPDRPSLFALGGLLLTGLLFAEPSRASSSWFCERDSRFGLPIPLFSGPVPDTSFALRPLFPIDLVNISPGASMHRESLRHMLLLINGYSNRCRPDHCVRPPTLVWVCFG